MASTPPANDEEQTPSSTPIFRQAGVRRTLSFSSSSPSHSRNSSFRSSSFSFTEEFPPFSPTTPLKFKGIPFSWEELPGIPKQQGSKKKETPAHLLPLPPAGNSNSSSGKSRSQEEISPKKHHHSTNRSQRDPFFAALVECSKDDEHDRGTNFGSSKNVTRSLSDRFGFRNSYTSCKRTCAVSESIVYLPRSRPHYLLNPRPS